MSAQIPAVLIDHWYVCGRKVRLDSSVIAELHAATRRVPVVPYPCPYGAHHWHVGKRQSGAGGMNHGRRQNARRMLAEMKERYR